MIDTSSGRPVWGRRVLWAASRDEAMVVEHLVNVGRRSALVRTAHLLVELGLRLQLVGAALGQAAAPVRSTNIIWPMHLGSPRST